jgi:flagellar biosynthesis/type III secretory pathway M-ring protein FliF/YscJ
MTPFLNDPKMMMIVAGGIAGLLLLAGAALFVIRKKSKKAAASAQSTAALAKGQGQAAALPNAASAAEAIQQQIQDKLAEQQALQAQADEAALTSLKLPAVQTKKSEILVKHLRESIVKDTPGSANILRSWLTESGGE